MPSELLGNASSDLVVRDLFDVRSNLGFVNIFAFVYQYVWARLRRCQSDGGHLARVGAMGEEVLQSSDCVVLAGRKDRHRTAEGEKQVLLDRWPGQVHTIPVHRYDVALACVLFGFAVLISAGYAPEGYLLGGLHRHNEQIPRLDPPPQRPELTRKVGQLALGCSGKGLAYYIGNLVASTEGCQIRDFPPAASRDAVLDRPRIALTEPA